MKIPEIPYLVADEPAELVDVEAVINSPEDEHDGRSSFLWFRLSNGGLILGTYPQGDVYEAISEKINI